MLLPSRALADLHVDAKRKRIETSAFQTSPIRIVGNSRAS